MTGMPAASGTQETDASSVPGGMTVVGPDGRSYALVAVPLEAAPAVDAARGPMENAAATASRAESGPQSGLLTVLVIAVAAYFADELTLGGVLSWVSLAIIPVALAIIWHRTRPPARDRRH